MQTPHPGRLTGGIRARSERPRELTWTIRAVGEATVLLDADEQYDLDPQGDPSIRTATYRAAPRAALAVTPHGPRPAKGRTQEEIDAYRAGQIDILGEVARAIADALYG